MKTSLCPLSLKYIGPKVWSDIPENLNLTRRIHLENNAKTSCYLAKIPVDFRFLCFSLFCNIVLIPLFSLISPASTLLTSPPVHRHAFPSLFFVVAFLPTVFFQTLI